MDTEKVLAALAQLDPYNDNHWTTDGMPRMDAVEAFLGVDIVRAQVTEAAPTLTRETAIDAAEKAAAVIHEAKAVAAAAEAPVAPVVEEEPEPEESPVPEELSLREMEEMDWDEVKKSESLLMRFHECIGRDMASLRQDEAEIREEMDELSEKSDRVVHALEEINKDEEKNLINNFVTRQAEIREEQAEQQEKANAILRSLGLEPVEKRA